LKIGQGKGKERAGSPKHKNTFLPFIGETAGHRAPNGWVLPMLAAFRADVKWDLERKSFEWIIPVDKVLKAVIDDLVGICVVEHKHNNVPPEQVGTRDSIYQSCYNVVRIFLAEVKK
jgi:hypothetical protein